MSKKSFGTQLFQGFVKSAVNQVGRDGGKVISNRVYDNAHSTPIRGISNLRSTHRTEMQSMDQLTFLTSPLYIYVFMFLGELILSPLGVLNHGANAVKYFSLVSQNEDPALKSLFRQKAIAHLTLTAFFGWLVYWIYSQFQNV